MATNDKQQAQTDTEGLVVGVYGGLNTTSNRASMPQEDSPDLLNVEIDYDGSVSKRKGFDIYESFGFDPRPQGGNIGTSHYYSLATNTPRYSLVFHRFCNVPGTNGAEMELCLMRDSTFLGKIGWVGAGNTIWSPEAASVKPDVVVLQDLGRIRLLYLTAQNTPIQFTIQETQIQVTSNTAPISTAFLGAKSNNTFVINTASGLVYYPSSYSGGTLNVTAPNGVYQVISVTWQWWARAVYAKGTWVGENVNRFAVDAVRDKTVAVPTSLTIGVPSFDLGALISPYPIIASSSFAYGAPYVYGTGTGVNDYRFSAGFSSDASGRGTASPNFITFGTAAAGTVVFHRGFDVRFEGNDFVPLNSGFQAKAVTPAGNVVSLPRNTSAAGNATKGSWQTRTTGMNVYYGSLFVPEIITFDGATDTSVNQEYDYLICYTLPSASTVGAGAVSTDFDVISDGMPWAAPGLAEIANFSRGSFPSCGSTFGGRLCLGGFRLAPGSVLVSELYDEAVVNSFYKNFQLLLNEGGSTDPFDFVLGFNDADDVIVAMREWQNSLWLWSRYGTYRITAGNNGFAFNTYSIQFVSATGCVNSQSVAVMDSSIAWLNSVGIYTLVPSGGLADSYVVQEMSNKIRTIFPNRANMDTQAYTLWDSVQQRLYVALPEFFNLVTTTWLVYFAQRDAWALWTNTGGESLTTRHAFISYTNTTNSNLFVAQLTISPDYFNDTTNRGFRLTRYPNTRYMDVLLGFNNTAPGWGQAPQYFVNLGTESSVFEYYTTRVKTGQLTGFRMCPFTDVQDVDVFLDGGKLEFGRDYIKTNYSSIILNFDPQAVSTLIIEQRTPTGLTPSALVGNKKTWMAAKTDVPFKPTLPTWAPVEYTHTNQGETEALYVVATFYPSWHSTISMTRGTMALYKRMQKYIGYYKNDVAGQRWARVDIKPGESLENIGLTENQVGMNIIVLFNDEDNGYYAADVYGNDDVTWDVDNLGLGAPARQRTDYARMFIPIIGTGYNWQVINYNFDHKTWKISGYETQVKLKKARGYSKAD